MPKFYQDNVKIQFSNTHVKLEGFSSSRKEKKKMKNRHLSKAVQEQRFFRFRQQLEYKCNDKGIQLIVADRFYPSSKLCSCCGNIKKDLKLSDRVYRCECGNMIDRDFQASINLKAYGERFAS